MLLLKPAGSPRIGIGVGKDETVLVKVPWGSRGYAFRLLASGAFKPHVESEIVLFFFLEEIRRGPPLSGSCGP